MLQGFLCIRYTLFIPPVLLSILLHSAQFCSLPSGAEFYRLHQQTSLCSGSWLSNDRCLYIEWEDNEVSVFIPLVASLLDCHKLTVVTILYHRPQLPLGFFPYTYSSHFSLPLTAPFLYPFRPRVNGFLLL